ncbi:MAG: VCBS repeat-containing protein, partial [Dokdonella sp.]
MRRLLWTCLWILAASGAQAAVPVPVLKWAWGGCFGSWCQTGWYSSPAVVDIDGDGRREVVAGSYDLVALDGLDGALRWRAANGGRVWPGVAIADLDDDGRADIVVGRAGGQVSVHRLDGSLRSGWPVAAFASGEVRSLALA